MQPSGGEDEAQPTLARRSPFAPTRRLCPRCLNQLQAGSKLGGWLIPQDYYCPNCGYQGTVFVEKASPKTDGEREG